MYPDVCRSFVFRHRAFVVHRSPKLKGRFMATTIGDGYSNL